MQFLEIYRKETTRPSVCPFLLQSHYRTAALHTTTGKSSVNLTIHYSSSYLFRRIQYRPAIRKPR